MKKVRILVTLVVLWAVVALVSVQAQQNAVGTVTTKVLVRGAPIHGTNGIMFDDQDRLYIASVVGRELVIMDARSGRIIDRLGPDAGVESPDDLAFGPDGSVYWTSLLTGVVGRRTPAGEVTTQFVAPGANPM